MGARDFGGYVKPQPQPLLAWSNGAAEKWLKEALHRCRRDRLPSIRHGKFEDPRARCGAHLNRDVRRSMGHGVAEKVREQLGYPGAVAMHNFRERKLGLYSPVRMRRPQLLYHLKKGGPYGFACSPLQCQAPAKTAPCKIERVINLTKSHFLRLGQNRRLSSSLRRHAPLLLTRIARVDSLVSQLICDLEGELKLAVRQVTVCLDDG